jgi:coproporphyrinogen III oxidase-like Fe-S oxidoreductase
MLGLRLCEGIDVEGFLAATGLDPRRLFAQAIQQNQAAGLIAADAAHIALTRAGRLLADVVMADFLQPIT